MKKIYSVALLLAIFVAGQAIAQKRSDEDRAWYVKKAQAGRKIAPIHRSFDNLSLGISASTLGAGVSLATPLSRHLSLRASFAMLPDIKAYSYTFKDFPEVHMSDGFTVQVPDLSAKFNTGFKNGIIQIDYVPFRQGRSTFFLTVGAVYGTNSLVSATGTFDREHTIAAIQAGYKNSHGTELPYDDAAGYLDDFYDGASYDFDGTEVNMHGGKLDVKIKTWKLRPYVGFGFGRPIPKGRVGFRFEFGAIFHGKPEISSPNIQGDPINTSSSDELSDVGDAINKVRKYAIAYPQIKFELTFRLLKNKNQ